MLACVFVCVCGDKLQRTCLGQNGLIPHGHAETGFGVAVCYCLLSVRIIPLLDTGHIPDL